MQACLGQALVAVLCCRCSPDAMLSQKLAWEGLARECSWRWMSEPQCDQGRSAALLLRSTSARCWLWATGRSMPAEYVALRLHMVVSRMQVHLLHCRLCKTLPVGVVIRTGVWSPVMLVRKGRVD
jgi:hypothetical protein